MSAKVKKRELKDTYDKEVTNPKNIIVNFKYAFSLMSLNINKFNNHFPTDDAMKSFHKKLFTEIIPTISQKTFNTLAAEKYKFHKISEDKRDLVERIVIELVENTKKINDYTPILNDLHEIEFFEISTPKSNSKSIRLIGTIDGNEFIVYFIDWHHMVYPDERYINNDIKKYDVSLISCNDEVTV